MSERRPFVSRVKNFFEGHRRVSGESEPKTVKPLVVGEGDNKIILISAERMAEIHEEALRAADQIIEKQNTYFKDDFLFLRSLVVGLITGGELERHSGREKR